MKELSIDEKANLYDEALEKAKYYHDRDNIQFLENIFPELAESEEERIRKALIKYYSFDKDGGSHALDNITPKQIVAYLEKQCKQKSIWGKEDEYKLSILEALCDDQINSSASYSTMYREMHELKDWLKSLKPQNTWKPSEEQLKSLRWVIEYGNTTQTETLKGIYEQLKKLKGE